MNPSELSSSTQGSSDFQPQILVTGADGFIGTNLVKRITHEGYKVWAPRLDQFDLTRPNEISDFIRAHRPHLVFHLAGLSHIPTCEKDPKLAFEVNLNGTLHLARALVQHSPQSILVFPSTAQIYENNLNTPGGLTENSPVRPQNTYAETKWLAEKALEHYRDHHHLNSIVLRLFNHTHVSQTEQFFLPSMYQQLLRARNLKQPQITVGSLDLWRDLGSIQDLLAAFSQIIRRFLLEPKAPLQAHTFNVCSGVAKNLRVLVESLAARIVNPRETMPHFVVDPTRVRSNDAFSIQGNCELFSKTFDWKPTAVTEEALIQSFLERLDLEPLNSPDPILSTRSSVLG